MTAFGVWDRLNPIAPGLTGPTWFADGVAPRIFPWLVLYPSCDTGPLFTRKGQHALNTRSAIERSAQRSAIDIFASRPHACIGRDSLRKHALRVVAAVGFEYQSPDGMAKFPSVFLGI